MKKRNASLLLVARRDELFERRAVLQQNGGFLTFGIIWQDRAQTFRKFSSGWKETDHQLPLQHQLAQVSQDSIWRGLSYVFMNIYDILLQWLMGDKHPILIMKRTFQERCWASMSTFPRKVIPSTPTSWAQYAVTRPRQLGSYDWKNVLLSSIPPGKWIAQLPCILFYFFVVYICLIMAPYKSPPFFGSSCYLLSPLSVLVFHRCFFWLRFIWRVGIPVGISSWKWRSPKPSTQTTHFYHYLFYHEVLWTHFWCLMRNSKAMNRDSDSSNWG